MGYKVKWVVEHLGVTRKALRVFEKAGLMPENKGGNIEIMTMTIWTGFGRYAFYREWATHLKK